MTPPIFATPIDFAETLLTEARAIGSSTLVVADGPAFGAPTASAPVRVTVRRASDGAATHLVFSGRAGDTLTGGAVEPGYADLALDAGDAAAVTASAPALAEIHAAIGDLAAALDATTGAVTSVAGRAGAVTLSTADVAGLGSLATQDIDLTGRADTLILSWNEAAQSFEFIDPGFVVDADRADGRLIAWSDVAEANVYVPAPTIDGLLPPQFGLAGKVLGSNGSAASWVDPPSGGGVTSVAGRAGVVVLSTADVVGLDGALAAKAAASALASHAANAANPHAVTAAQVGAYATAQADALLAGKAPSVHAHDAAAITSGIIAPSRLGTGTADATTVLHGDGSYKVPPSGDLLAPQAATPATISGPATLDATAFGRWHLCSGTSADYTVTLPPPEAGKLVGFRMSPGLTRLVTIAAGGASLIDGAASRVLWRSEACVLLCDGTGWAKVSGRSIPMQCQMRRASPQSIPGPSPTRVGLDTVEIDPTSLMGEVTNQGVRIKRPGTYQVACNVLYDAAGNGSNIQVASFKNSSSPSDQLGSDVRSNSGGVAYPQPACVTFAALADGDIVYSYTQQNTGSAVSLFLAPGLATLYVLEVPTW